MKLHTFIASILLSLVFVPVANSLAEESSTIVSADLAASLGYRVDQLDWSIAGDSTGQNPNILSELTWRDIKSLQLQLDGKLELQPSFWSNANTYFQGSVATGKIYSGTQRDSDYAGDSRTLEWSRSDNISDDGYTFDISGAVGTKFNHLYRSLSITPLLGYSFHMQDLSITDGKQTLSNDTIHDAYDPAASEHPPSLGPFPGLDSTYAAYWYGPWIGLTVAAAPAEKWHVALSGEYHWIEYFAEANWNLRTDLNHPVSFEHEARGTGMVMALETDYAMSERWSLQLSAKLQYWESGVGTDTTYLANGSRGGTQFNGASWESYALMTGLSYRF